MASIPDLVEIEARIQAVGDEGDMDVAHDLVTLTLPKLLAELRAAREVVKQTRGYLAMFYGTSELRQAVAEYDARRG